MNIFTIFINIMTKQEEELILFKNYDIMKLLQKREETGACLYRQVFKRGTAGLTVGKR